MLVFCLIWCRMRSNKKLQYAQHMLKLEVKRAQAAGVDMSQFDFQVSQISQIPDYNNRDNFKGQLDDDDTCKNKQQFKTKDKLRNMDAVTDDFSTIKPSKLGYNSELQSGYDLPESTQKEYASKFEGRQQRQFSELERIASIKGVEEEYIAGVSSTTKLKNTKIKQQDSDW